MLQNEILAHGALADSPLSLASPVRSRYSCFRFIADTQDPKEDPKKLSGEKEDKKDAAPASPESKKRKNPSSEQEGTTEKTAEKEVKEGGAKEEVEGEDVAMDADDEASSSTNRKASTTKKEEKAEVEGSIGDDEKDEIKKLEADAAKQNGNGHAKENGKANGKAEAAENGEEETSNGSQKETDDEPVAKKAKLDTSDDSTTISNGNGTTNGSTTTTNGSTTAKQDETVPGDGEHLDHPENWTTGDEPATEKQKGYVAVLEKKAGKPVSDKEGLGKSEASEIIEKLKG